MLQLLRDSELAKTHYSGRVMEVCRHSSQYNGRKGIIVGRPRQGSVFIQLLKEETETVTVEESSSSTSSSTSSTSMNMTNELKNGKRGRNEKDLQRRSKRSKKPKVAEKSEKNSNGEMDVKKGKQQGEADDDNNDEGLLLKVSSKQVSFFQSFYIFFSIFHFLTFFNFFHFWVSLT